MGPGSSTSFLLATLAVVDISVLITSPLFDWPEYGPIKFPFRTYNNLACKFSSFLLSAIPTISSYNIVLLSIFRTIGIFLPHKYKSICTKRRAVICFSAIVFITILVCLHLFLRAELVIDTKNRQYACAKEFGNSYFTQTIVPHLMNLYKIYIPLVIIFITNICIIAKLASRKFGQEESGSKITITLISVSVLFLITQIPMAAFVIWRQTQIWTKKSLRQQVMSLFYWTVVSNISIINNSGNFILYCLTGARFRGELLGIICFWRTKIPSTKVKRSLSEMSSNSRNSLKRDIPE